MFKTLEQKLSKRSLGYSFVRNVFVRPAIYLFYRKIDVIGAKAVPDQGSVIFAPNHQNALMDALSILCTKDRQPVFVARADIFQKPLIIAILHFLRILPIFRKRDGGNSSDNNQETFDLILKILNHQQAIGIMPEGTHNEVKHLRVLQKGIFRLAMQAQEMHKNQPAVKIIPVGLEYSSTSKFRSDLIVRYGKAIEMADFYDSYAEDPARTFRHMQDTLSEKMREGMIDIEEGEYYNGIERLRVLYQKRALQRLALDCRKAEDRLRAQQKIIAAVQDHGTINPDETKGLCGMTIDYYKLIEKYNLHDWVIEQQPSSLVGLLGRSLLTLLGIPFWILGMLLNYLPYKLSVINSRKVKDPQFVSSVLFVLGLVLYPLYHLIMIILFFAFIPCIWGKIIMPFLFIPLGLFAYEYYLSIQKLSIRWQFWKKKHKKDQDLLFAICLREKIFETMGKINL